MVLSETDLNKSSISMHDYNMLTCGKVWVTHQFDYAWIMVGSTNATVMRNKCYRMTPTQSHWTSSKVTPHAKPHQRSVDRTRAPNNVISNIASHCETKNQQACLSDMHINVVLRHLQEKVWRNRLYFHIPSLITALPKRVISNHQLLALLLTTTILACCLRRDGAN